jgi:intracellular sulfur oxidation DsrE/DsrF family protein
MKLIKKVNAPIRDQVHTMLNNRQNYSSVYFKLHIFGKPMGKKYGVLTTQENKC